MKHVDQNFPFAVGRLLGFLGDKEIIEFLKERGVDEVYVKKMRLYLSEIANAFYRDPKDENE